MVPGTRVVAMEPGVMSLKRWVREAVESSRVESRYSSVVGCVLTLPGQCSSPVVDYFLVRYHTATSTTMYVRFVALGLL